MPFWMNTYFMDANSPTMEQMIFFHDHSMIMVLSIMTFLLLTIINLFLNKYINFNLNNNQIMEMIWTMSPMFILLFIAIPSLRLLYLMEEIFNPNITMKIIGHQWYWSYEFSNFNINFDSFMHPTNESKPMSMFQLLETDLPLFLPLNCPTRALVTSSDVIHSWTIQSLGIKTDAVPGRLNQINLFPTRPGLYFGQCSEICGMNHSFMPITLMISSLPKFNKLLLSFM